MNKWIHIWLIYRKAGMFSFLFMVCMPFAIGQQLISLQSEDNFPLLQSKTTIIIDPNDDWLVAKVASLFQKDLQSITGFGPEILSQPRPRFNYPIIIGTLRSSIISQLVRDKKLDVSKLENQWEAFQISTIPNPFTAEGKALVIAGSDKRGAAYGVFEISRQAGVSPWYWWADVPVKKDKPEIYIQTGDWLFPPPDVKYRGIFINDEHPSFANWAREKFGGVNHQVYEKIFELLLRLKANFLWPAMWDNAFNDDDPLNPELADKWGIVMSTSHHEPMMRAQKEWTRYGKGAWDYRANSENLKSFWKKGIERMGHHESVVTIGMRGDGDEPMTQGTAIHLLEQIVKDQRKIIEEVTDKPASETPQVWALYKEVQDYYDQGMRVPEDVTLLFSDDNWGNLRRLPPADTPERPGGYGIYYHFDYVGGPRNYKWINTNNISRIWEQMHLAWAYNARQIWIVNVGDLKPMELPISFFLDYAYRPANWTVDNIQNYFDQWATENFDKDWGHEIARVLEKYSQLSSRIKPELLTDQTYPYAPDKAKNEWDYVRQEWHELNASAERLKGKLGSEYQSAYYQLVLHPARAFGNLHDMYASLAKNKYYAALSDTTANRYADSVRFFYNLDSLITIEYHSINSGKWNHMMDQTHIGYTYWQQPPVNVMPHVQYVASSFNIKQQPVSAANQNNSAWSMVPADTKFPVFFESEGIVSIHAQHWSKAIADSGMKWVVIPGIGKTSDGVTLFPVKDWNGPMNNILQFDFYTNEGGSMLLAAYFSPTLNFLNKEAGLSFEIAVDDEPFQKMSLNKEDSTPVWEKWVASNNIVKVSHHSLGGAGRHQIRFRVSDPGIIIQKFVLAREQIPNSFQLGPNETIYQQKK